MSIKIIDDNSINNKHVNLYGLQPYKFTTWVRNPAWLPLPEVSNTESKIVALCAIDPDNSFISLTASNNFTVDWGDGIIENYTSGTVVNHTYQYSNANISGTSGEVTFQGSTDTVTLSNHAFTNNNVVNFYNLSGSIGIVEGATYYVINVSQNTFQISNTINGTAVDITNDGTGDLLKHKQAILTITPQAGQSLTSVDFNRLAPNYSVNNSTPLLDLKISGPNLANILIGANYGIQTFVTHRLLEQVDIIKSNVTRADSLFYNLIALRNIPTLDIRPTSARFTFSSCNVLEKIPFYDNSNNTDFNWAFDACISLRELPFLDTSRVSNFSNTFQNCYNLSYIPPLNTSNATYTGYMFRGAGIKTIPPLDLSKVTDAFGMFYQSSIETVPSLNTANVTNFTDMFRSCSFLTEVGQLNTSKATNTTNMFRDCISLLYIPECNLSNVTTASFMYSNTKADKIYVSNITTKLNTLDNFLNTAKLSELILTNCNTSNVTNMSAMFWNCRLIKEIPELNTSNVTNMSGTFSGCTILRNIPLWDTSNVTNMSCIFLNTSSITYVPTYNTTKVTNLSQAFQGCVNLNNIPVFNTSNVTNFSGAFNGCRNLKIIPGLNGNAVTSTANFNNIFASSTDLIEINLSNFKFSFSVASCKLSANNLYNIFNSLPNVNSQTITITGNPGIGSSTTKVVNLTQNNTTVIMTNTVGVTTGMFVSGTGLGITTPFISVSGNIENNNIVLSNHQISNNAAISFSSLGTVTGITANVIYYVINADTNTFQISNTINGSAITLGGITSTMTMRYATFVSNVNTNVSITLSTPPVSNQTSTTLTFRTLDLSVPLLKTWAVTI